MGLLKAIREKHGYLDPENTFDDSLDFIHAIGNPIDALLYYEAFCPRFVELEGCIKLNPSKGIEGKKEKDEILELINRYKKGEMKKEELSQAIYSYNFEEVLFMFNDRDCSEKAIYYLAQLMAESWRAQLAYKFPQYSFEVVVEPDKPDEYEPGPVVYIRQNLDHIKQN